MKKNKSILIRTGIFVLIASLIVFLLFRFNILNLADIKAVRHWILKIVKRFWHQSERFIYEHKSFAPILYIAIFTVRTLFIIVPYSGMIMLGGKIFGHIFGFIYSIIAIYLSSSLGFGLGRFLDRKVVERFLKKELKSMDSKVEKYGFRIIFFMRVSMLFHFDLLSFASGVTKMKYRDFALGTMLGIIPETFLFTYLGGNLNYPLSPKFKVSMIIVFIVVAIPFVLNIFRKKRKKDS